MMEFHAERPIYRQIADYVCARILEGEWKNGARVPSMRDLGAQMSVNAHTVLRAYESLQADGIMEVRRGMGYFLTEDARERALHLQRMEFIKTKAPEFFAEMTRLQLTLDDVLPEDLSKKS
ncbi:MAG: GntR family transcriptional regulator [Muribaculaceae bacterium]|nr:GntR family transcriptional regulator [Muribaculaceae bacterium]